MRLQCEECKEWHDIFEDNYDDHNIYRKVKPGQSAVTSMPSLLCRKCTDKVLEKLDKAVEYKIQTCFDVKHQPIYYITADGVKLSKPEVAAAYKPLGHYPFTDTGWAYYHLNELKKKVGTI